MIRVPRSYWSRLRFILLLAACLLSLFQAPLAMAADTTGMCDPNSPERKAKYNYRAGNDILYFDDCANTCSGSASASLLPGDNNAEKAYNYLISKGYTPEQAAGIVGNMILESGVNPQRLQNTGLNDQTPADQAVGSSSGWGIVQWTPAGKMIQPTQDAGKDPNDLGVQLDFLTMGDKLNGGAQSDAADKVRATNTVNDATEAFGRYYEAPTDLSASISLRKTYAEAIYDKATKGTPLPPEVESAIYKGDGSTPADAAGSVTQPGGAACGSKATDNGECQNPFRDLQNSAPLRYDGGLDYGGDQGSGPVYAACPAEITLVQTGGASGWPGDPGLYMAYKITAGKAKDLYMYIAEDCKPLVKVGDQVTTDQPICQYEQHSTYLEIGWSESGQNSYVKWSDYQPHNNAGQNGWASNSGLDVGHFLETLGVGKGVVQEGPSDVPPPADWPKW